MIGHLESHDSTKGDNKDADVIDAQKLLEKFFQDQDSRVRSSAFQALVNFVSSCYSFLKAFYLFLIQQWTSFDNTNKTVDSSPIPKEKGIFP